MELIGTKVMPGPYRFTPTSPALYALCAYQSECTNLFSNTWLDAPKNRTVNRMVCNYPEDKGYLNDSGRNW